ncbi:MAG: PH domain-containing protein [Actinomycetes bacterium]
MWIRASRMTPLTGMCAWSIVVGTLLLASGETSLVLPGASLVVVCVSLVVAHVSRAGVRLDPDGVAIRGVLRRRRVGWAGIASIRTEYLVDYRGTAGDVVRFLDARERPVAGAVPVPVLVKESATRFETFVALHGIGVPVNPPSDPRARFEVWRPDPFDHDPFESIRTVRRAVVGPYVVIVRPRGDRFVALTIDERTGEPVVVSDDRADLASAIEAAVDQIRDAQRRHAVEG